MKKQPISFSSKIFYKVSFLSQPNPLFCRKLSSNLVQLSAWQIQHRSEIFPKAAVKKNYKK